MNDPIKIGESDDWMGRMGGLTVVDFQLQRFSEFEDDWVHVVHVWKKNCQKLSMSTYIISYIHLLHIICNSVHTKNMTVMNFPVRNFNF